MQQEDAAAVAAKKQTNTHTHTHTHTLTRNKHTQALRLPLAAYTCSGHAGALCGFETPQLPAR